MEQESAGGGAADVGAARIGLWGCFDAAIFGDLIAARVVEAELRRRSPGAEVRTFAPFGRLRPIPLDAGRLAEPFGPQTPARLSELSSELDAAFVGSGDLLTFDDTHFAAWYELPAGDLAPLRVGRWLIEGFGETEDRPALAWNALGVPHDLDRDGAVRVRAAARSAVYLSVRDERSRARLLAAGVEREITVVPEPALFARRVFSPAHLERRLAYLRAMEWFPRTGRALVVHVGEPLSRDPERIATLLEDAAARHGGVAIVLVSLSPALGDRERVDTLAVHLAGGAHVIPECATLADLAAVVANAALLVTSAPDAQAVAVGFGTPTLFVDPSSAPDALAAQLSALLSGAGAPAEATELERRLDAHFDVLAEIAERSAWERPQRGPAPWRRASTRIAAEARRADSLRGARDSALASGAGERLRLSETIDGERRERARLERDLQRLEGELRAMRAEFERVLDLRLFRYTAPARELYRRLRGLLKGGRA